MYIFFIQKQIFKTNLFFGFHISKLNNLEVIYNLYFQYLTLYKTTSISNIEGVIIFNLFFAQESRQTSLLLARFLNLFIGV